MVKNRRNPQVFDFRISGGCVLDGTGTAARRFDVGILGDRIEDVGDLSAAAARTTIDAAGCLVCPGFIDVHTHSDAFLLIEPSSPSKLFQGITTEVLGNCGVSAAPVEGAFRLPSDWADKEYARPWRTVTEYCDLLRDAGPAPNVVLLVGHANLRGAAIGYANRPAGRDEIRAMEGMLTRALDEGAHGLSTGLVYPPGAFAAQEELAAMARIVAAREGIYTSHMRSEGKDLQNSVKETLSLARKTGVRAQISHLKVSGRNYWSTLEEALTRIRESRAAGVQVAADRYPYTRSSTELDVIFPVWAQEGGREAVLARLRDPGDRAKLRAELLRDRTSDFWDTITVASTCNPGHREFRGMKLADIASILGMSPVDAVLFLLDADELRTSAFFSSMSEENMRKVLAEPYVMIGSDASLRAPAGVLSRDHPHPRAYGAFTRFLGMAIHGKTVPIPEAVRKMTSLPAEHFRLRDRGRIARGMKADIAVFAPDRVSDCATYEAPHQLSEGTEYVLVNGVATVARGALTGRRAGRVL